jgi:hypothetical protein
VRVIVRCQNEGDAVPAMSGADPETGVQLNDDGSLTVRAGDRAVTFARGVWSAVICDAEPGDTE